MSSAPGVPEVGAPTGDIGSERSGDGDSTRQGGRGRHGRAAEVHCWNSQIDNFHERHSTAIAHRSVWTRSRKRASAEPASTEGPDSRRGRKKEPRGSDSLRSSAGGTNRVELRRCSRRAAGERALMPRHDHGAALATAARLAHQLTTPESRTCRWTRHAVGFWSGERRMQARRAARLGAIMQAPVKCITMR